MPGDVLWGDVLLLVTFCGVTYCGVTFCGVTFCRGTKKLNSNGGGGVNHFYNLVHGLSLPLMDKSLN